jgi:hypothetical protein
MHNGSASGMRHVQHTPPPCSHPAHTEGGHLPHKCSTRQSAPHQSFPAHCKGEGALNGQWVAACICTLCRHPPLMAATAVPDGEWEGHITHSTSRHQDYNSLWLTDGMDQARKDAACAVQHCMVLPCDGRCQDDYEPCPHYRKRTSQNARQPSIALQVVPFKGACR